MNTHAGAAIPSPDTSLGDSFAWPFRDPEWFNKIVLMGLIGLIPVVGWLQLLGWMLASLDNLRHGWQVLPPAAFRYATRGINLFAASLMHVSIDNLARLRQSPRSRRLPHSPVAARTQPLDELVSGDRFGTRLTK